MSAQGRDRREWKRIELQLDTAQILLVIAMLLGLCASSFYLGRWIERDRWNGSAAAGKGRGAVPGALGGTDAAQDLTFFDTLGGKTSAEPSRQARAGGGTGGTGAPRAPAPVKAATPGSAGSTESAEGPVDGASGSAAPDRPPVQGGATGSAGGAPPASTGRTGAGSSSPASSSSSSSPVKGAFAIQVFSGEKAQAEKIAASLARKGYAARTAPAGPGSTAVRVRIYGYKTRPDADRAAARVKTEDHLSAWVVKAD